MTKKIIHVTKPYLPPLAELQPFLEDIWQSRLLTNNSKYNRLFCKALENLWGVEHVVTFSNGTQALIAALSCMTNKTDGEVITTPFTFIATTNSIIWSGHKPVFVDIDENDLNINPDNVEAAINEKTIAILAVHCYGEPCNVARLEQLSKKYNIPVIYDAAHAFGVEVNGKNVFQFGEMSAVSFHATKVMNTFEGGAVACHSAVMKSKLINFANFGFQNETTINSLGLNAKLSEFNAALGLAQLNHLDAILSIRKQIANTYINELSGVKGIIFPKIKSSTTSNYAYFPILLEENAKSSRDDIYHYLREYGYMVRRYFYPLTCDFAIPEVEEHAIKLSINVARRRAEQVLCLPIYPDLPINTVHEIAALLKEHLV